MKKISFLLFVHILFSIQLFSQNTWIQKATFPGLGKDYPAAFSIGDKGYFGTGASINISNMTDDFWEFDPTLNTWTQKANFPGGVRWIASGFSIGSKGYMGMGFDLLDNATFDLWEYDPSTNNWTRKANCPVARASAVSFSIGNFGYVCGGLTSSFLNVLNDFWEYDAANDAWTQKASLPGPARSEAMGFSIGTRGYVGTGWDGSQFLSDFWEWNQGTNTWTQKANFPDGRVDDAGFSIGCKGYLTIGESSNSGTYANDLWEYDPIVNTWTQKANFPGPLRDETYAISIGCQGYVGFGQDVNSIYLSDMWEYTPDSSVQICCGTPIVYPPNPESSSLSIPNVFTPNADGTNDVFLITSKNITSFSCEIYDRWGIKIYSWTDITTGWDGKDHSGKYCTDGVYYYTLIATGIDNVNYKKSGFVSLLK